ncbi:glycosyltransferase family 4 protein [Aestuariivivens sediminicola]|uniref:glycosyltransferase family 4 protein n=1 Tax=Aestuariivivens sediminicola TaxID=2913560 RepID=UPI001F5A76BF|nr:glycosyltransferase family 4 protein [Aestuariivivens sediminicola]
MRHKLVILTTRFGTNFSGGAKATCEVFSRIQNQFESITVLGTEIGNHQIKNVKFIKTNYWIDALFKIMRLKDDCTIFYGDFYNAFLLGVAQAPFVFTYHDNWPELSKLNTKSYFQNLFFNTVYTYIFKKAKALVAVSNFKRINLIQYEEKLHFISNGFSRGNQECIKEHKSRQVLMVGNIDERKYNLAIKLFDLLKVHDGISIDIYGHIVNKDLAKKLKSYPFVEIKGFVENVPYSAYKLLLHTSFSESFGLVFYESIYNETPVLTFNTGGAPEIISTENGRMVDAFNIKDMYRVLKEMLANPFKANSQTVDSYSWDRASSNYLKLFQYVD